MSLRNFKPQFPVQDQLKPLFEPLKMPPFSDADSETAFMNGLPAFVQSHPETANFVLLKLTDMSCGCLFAKQLSEMIDGFASVFSKADQFYVHQLCAKLCKFRYFPELPRLILEYMTQTPEHLRVAAYSLLSPRNLAELCGIGQKDLLKGRELRNFAVLDALCDNISALRREVLDVGVMDALYCNFLLVYIMAEQSTAIQAYFCEKQLISAINTFLNRNEVQQNQKVLRSLIRAMMALATEDGQQQMVAIDVHVTIELLLETSLDEQVKMLARELFAQLQGKINLMSTIECYKEQLASRIMQMTPMHLSTVFWKQNAEHFVEGQCKMLKDLVEVGIKALETQDYETVRTVLNDFGQFAVFHPRGRQIIYKIGEIRDFVVSTYSLEDEDVVELAVGCLAKLMVTDWDSV